MKLVNFILSLFAVLTKPISYGEAGDNVHEVETNDENNGMNFENLSRTWGVNYIPEGKIEPTPSKDGKTPDEEEIQRRQLDKLKNEKGINNGTGTNGTGTNGTGTEKKPEGSEGTTGSQEESKKEISVDFEITKEKAAELTKDYDDDDIIIIDGNKTTKAEYLKSFDKPAAGNEDNTGTEKGNETIEVGNKKLTTEEYNELIEKASKHYGWTTDYVEKADENTLKQSLKDYMNFKDGSRNINEKNQDLSKLKRELERKALEIDNSFTSLEEEKKNLELRKDELKKILDKDPDTITDDTQRTKLISQQATAEDKIEEIDNALKDNEEKKKTLDTESSKNWYKQTWIEQQSTIPVFVQDKPCWAIIDETNQKLKEGKTKDPNFRLSEEDIKNHQIANASWKFINEYAKYLIDTNLDITAKEYFDMNSRRYLSMLPDGVTAQPGKTNTGGSDKKNEKSLIIQIVKKQNGSLGGVNGNTNGGVSKKLEGEVDIHENRDELIRKTMKVNSDAFNV